MKTSSWISVVALSTAVVGGLLAGPVGCGSEEPGNHPGLLDGGGAGGAAASTGGAGGVGNSKALGLACASDADCQDGLMCLTSTSGAIDSASPAHGICTMPCGSTSDTTTCKRISGDATCFPVSSTEAYCFAGCKLGTPFFGDVKCQQRPDLACAPGWDVETLAGDCQSDTQCPTGYQCLGKCVLVTTSCVPQCNADADCETGQHCDFQAALAFPGLCRPNAPTGLPTGAACVPNAGVDVCRGVCIPVSDTVGECADGCTLGATETCGWSGTGPADATCQPYFTTSGAGDAGVCLQLCDCNDDCRNPAMICDAFAVGSSLATRSGRRGICNVPAAGGAGGASGLPCAGGAGGSSATGGTAGAGG